MCCVFFFNDTATTEIYTLSLHDALPILRAARHGSDGSGGDAVLPGGTGGQGDGRTQRPGGMTSPSAVFLGADAGGDRKSTRLNSSHGYISYAVFCLKKKKTKTHRRCAPT